MENGKRPINARTAFNSHGGITTNFEEYNGLTKREYFAGLAMQGLLANEQGFYLNKHVKTSEGFEHKAVFCVRIADELLKQLEE